MKKIYLLIAALLALVLVGCAGVEPERRSYPLVMSVDYVQDELQVIYSMANLPQQTGQQKSAGESDLVPVFTGKTMAQVLKSYDSSQEYYLDQGHIQVVILGEKLLQAEQQLQQVLIYLEQEPMIADSIFMFTCKDSKKLLASNGNTVESLGEYLVGIYKNRIVSREDQAVTLQEMLYSWHNEGQAAVLPEITQKDDRPQITSLSD